jgi:hypothetical protein
MLVGALASLPGASYLTALHHLIAGNTPSPRRSSPMLSVLIEFLLIIIPLGSWSCGPRP